MDKKKVIKVSLMIIGVAIVLAGSFAYYLFNQPHRDVQATKTDFVVESSEIVNEFLSNATLANEKYLDSEGESKIIETTGYIFEISEDFNNNKVMILKSENDKAGVSCTFTPETNNNTSSFKIGDKISIKGVIRSGASYDSDLSMYEDVIMEKCDVISK